MNVGIIQVLGENPHFLVIYVLALFETLYYLIKDFRTKGSPGEILLPTIGLLLFFGLLLYLIFMIDIGSYAWRSVFLQSFPSLSRPVILLIEIAATSIGYLYMARYVAKKYLSELKGKRTSYILRTFFTLISIMGGFVAYVTVIFILGLTRYFFVSKL